MDAIFNMPFDKLKKTIAKNPKRVKVMLEKAAEEAAKLKRSADLAIDSAKAERQARTEDRKTMSESFDDYRRKVNKDILRFKSNSVHHYQMMCKYRALLNSHNLFLKSTTSDQNVPSVDVPTYEVPMSADH
uniref:Vps5 domain-containing protein n=1 Tax=Steinernema glaseri TaxID=37863 RepID=A0A1I7XWQ3_9BILA